MRKSIASFFALTAAALSSTPAFALHEFPTVGDRGDAGAHAECPEGKQLVGFSGRTGAWIDAVQMVCAAVGQQPIATGARYGGAGGQAVDSFCHKGWQMNAIFLNMTTHNARVASISYTCKSVKTGETQPFTFGNGSYMARCPGFGVGNCASTDNTYQPCAADEVPIGFNVRYGKDVNALGLICGRVKGAR